MMKYKSRWRDRDLKMLDGTNKLYEIVRYYGGYLWYCANENQGAYNAFYHHNKDKMQKIFINTANADAKRHFNRIGISGTRMRKLLITGKGNIVRSYEWVSDYVEYILDKCMEKDELKDKVFHILQDECSYCREQVDIKEWRMLCTKRLLGFQYTLLNDVSKRKNRESKSAEINIHAIEQSVFINRVIESCPVVINKKNYSII